MSYGFSVYFGLDNTEAENMWLLEQAQLLGYTRIFTSLHIPEANYEVLKREVRTFFQVAKASEMDIISDISPNTFAFLGLANMDLAGLYQLGVRTIRIDFGYQPAEIAAMTRNEVGMRIQLNASTITEAFFAELDLHAPNYEQLDALHNFYPRIGTGISQACLQEKNDLLHARNIRVGAFVQSNHRKRSPMRDGLPTLEDHRGWDVRQAANHLFALDNDFVLIGDSLPSLAELQALASLQPDVVELRITLDTTCDSSRYLLAQTYTSRTDEARDAIRASESRLLLNQQHIRPEHTLAKKRGTITIDNQAYARYEGELQILLCEQAADARTNVVAQVVAADHYLLPFIRHGRQFAFSFVSNVKSTAKY